MQLPKAIPVFRHVKPNNGSPGVSRLDVKLKSRLHIPSHPNPHELSSCQHANILQHKFSQQFKNQTTLPSNRTLSETMATLLPFLKVFLLLVLIHLKTTASLEKPGSEKTPFAMILESIGHEGQTISADEMTEVLSHLFEQFDCSTSEGGKCEKCLQLPVVKQFLASGQLNESQFDQLSTVILYLAGNLDNTSHHVCDGSLASTYDAAAYLVDGETNLSLATLERYLERLTSYHGHHDHDHHDDEDHDQSGEDHQKHEEHEEEHEEGHEEEHEEHEEGHDEEHEEEHEKQEEGHEEEHEKHEEGHDEEHEKHEEGHEEEHEKHEEGHEEEHEKHEEGHEEQSEALTSLLCFNADLLFDWSGVSPSSGATKQQLNKVASWAVFALYSGYKLQEKCPVQLLPVPDAILQDLYTLQGKSVAAELDTHDVEALMKSLGIGPVGGEEEEHGSGDLHDHRRRRRSAPANATARQCLSAAQLQLIYGAVPHVTSSQLVAMTTAFVQQKLWGGCQAINDTDSDVQLNSVLNKYGYGTLSVAVISLLAIAGVLVVPLIHKAVYNVLMTFLIALSVGTLVGDAFLHLLPEGLGLHKHGNHAQHSEELVIEPFVWHQLAALGAIFLFFVVESVMGICSRSGKAQKYLAGNSGNHEGGIIGHGHSHSVPKQEAFKVCKHKHDDTPVDLQEAANAPGDSESKSSTLTIDGSTTKSTDVLIKSQQVCGNGCTTLALMIVMGDILHNLMDGIAIGAAFSVDNVSGLSTSIAVFCHELPHELGDFAVLLSSGLSIKKALFLNVVAALHAFVGLYIGLAVGVDDTVRGYLFVITAGMFTYVALSNMLPELVHSQQSQHTKGAFGIFLSQILGILMGYGCLLLLSVYETRIAV